MSMIYIGAATAIVGVGLSAYGMYQGGQQAEKVGESNAQIYEQEAGVVKENAALNEYRQRKDLRYSVGSMNAGYAGAGVSVSTGSPLDAIADSIANAELEIQMTKYNALADEKLKMSQARLSRAYGADAARTSSLQATGTLLQGAGNLANRFSSEKIGGTPKATPKSQTIGGGFATGGPR